MPSVKLRRRCAWVVLVLAVCRLFCSVVVDLGIVALEPVGLLQDYLLPGAFLIWAVYTIIRLRGAVDEDLPTTHQEEMIQAAYGRARKKRRK